MFVTEIFYAILLFIPDFFIILIQLCRLRSLLSKKTAYYSLGERKKLLLIAALLKKPRYLILDEIANGLDIDSLKWLTTQLDKQKNNCLILVTGHYLEFYEKILDEIIIIQNKNIHKIEKGGQPLYELYEKLC